MAINNPHDTFFKSVFSEKENAIGHLEVILPPRLGKNIDLNTIKIEKKSYLDDELKKCYSDIVYTGYYKDSTVKLSFLYEHKSYAVKYPHFQILRYMLNIWEMSIKQKEKLPVVIPIIVYHGTEKWIVKPLYSYFDNIDEELMPFIPNFTYILSDLSKYSNEDIKNKVFKGIFLKAALLILKNSFHPEQLIEALDKFVEIGYIYNEEDKGTIFLLKVIRYIYSLWEIKSDEHYQGKIEQILGKQGVDVMTILEDIELKAEKRGKEKQKIIDKQDILIRQLNKKFGLSRDEVTLIKSIKDITKLDAALDEFVFSESKSGVLDLLK
jgi:predicted transposase/invertase (TIGR01784 family)